MSSAHKCVPTVPLLTSPPMWGWQGWYLIADLFVLFLVLFADITPIEFSMVAATLMLIVAGVITTAEGLAGFSNAGILAVACLFIIAEALASTGAIDYYMQKILSRPRTIGDALIRMFIPVTFLGAFISSTAVVALMTPILLRWCRQCNIAPSQIFMPMCFAVHLGGTCTLIGTTTNLVIAGLAQQYYCTNMGIFQLVPVGVPAAIAGNGLMLLIAPPICPSMKEYESRTKGALIDSRPVRKPIWTRIVQGLWRMLRRIPPEILDGDQGEEADNLIHVNEGHEISREARDADFTFHARVPLQNGPATSSERAPRRTVEDAGLRHLPGLFLIAVQRGNTRYAAVGSDFEIEPGDLLSFAGSSANFVALCREKQLEPITVDGSTDKGGGGEDGNSTKDASSKNPLSMYTVQAVVKSGSSLVDQTPKMANFRTTYNASIIAIHRAGEKLAASRLGQVRLKVGDILVLITGDQFDWNNPKTMADLVPRFSNAQDAAAHSLHVGGDKASGGEVAFAMKIAHKVKDLLMVRPLAGRTIDDAGLRNIVGVRVVGLEREGKVEMAIGPDVVLQVGDIVWFVGDREGISAARRVPGLEELESKNIDRLKIAPQNRRLVEVVVSLQSDLLHKTVRESRFRTRFGAAIVGIQRRHTRMVTKFGDVVLQPGDVLILDTGPGFIQRFRDDPNFLLITEVAQSTPPRFDRFYFACVICVAMVVVAAAVQTPSGTIELVIPAAFACGFLLAFGVTTQKRAHASIDWKIIITIASAFGLAAGMTDTGVAAVIGKALTDLAIVTGTGEIGVLAAVLICTEIVAAAITAKASAVILFPIAANAAARAHINPTLMLITLMVGANSFITPQGHQTNLMVMSPGAYKFVDYQKLGWPVMIWINIVQLVCLAYYDYYYITIPLSIAFFYGCVLIDHVFVAKLGIRDTAGYRIITGQFCRRQHPVPERRASNDADAPSVGVGGELVDV